MKMKEPKVGDLVYYSYHNSTKYNTIDIIKSVDLLNQEVSHAEFVSLNPIKDGTWTLNIDELIFIGNGVWLKEIK